MRGQRVLAALAIVCLGLIIPLGAMADDGPWVGSYVVKFPDELLELIKESGNKVPTINITILADGNYTVDGVEAGEEFTGKGHYTVDGNTLTMIQTERDGEPGEALPAPSVQETLMV